MNTNKKTYLVLSIISILVLAGFSFAISIPIVRKNREDDVLSSRIEPIFQSDYSLIKENGTTICGCNFTQTILIINITAIQQEPNSFFGLRIHREDGNGFLRFPYTPYLVILNKTSHINGVDFYRDRLFFNWSTSFQISILEEFNSHYTFFGRTYEVSFTENHFISNFSILRGFY